MQVEHHQGIASAPQKRERLQIMRPVQLNRVGQRLIPRRIGAEVRRLQHQRIARDRLICQLQRVKLRPATVGHTHVNHRAPQVN